MTIGDKIRRARRQAGLTIEELAGRCGRTKQQIAAWEGGVNDIRYGNLEQIAEALELPISVLVSDDVETVALTVGEAQP